MDIKKWYKKHTIIEHIIIGPREEISNIILAADDPYFNFNYDGVGEGYGFFYASGDMIAFQLTQLPVMKVPDRTTAKYYAKMPSYKLYARKVKAVKKFKWTL